MSTLREALAVGEREVVAFVGAGGKTSAMFRLARELRASGAGVVVTTTTRVRVPTDDDVRVIVGALAELRRGIAAAGDGIPVVAAAETDDGKLAGIGPEAVGVVAAFPGVTHVLVEADGAAGRPIKAPREGEPVIPDAATLVVAVVGVDALGQTVGSVAHRPERVMALTGLGRDDALDARSIARVMVGADGVTRGTPSRARVAALVNKADDAVRAERARRIAGELLRAGAALVVVTSLERPGAVVDVIRR
ncbi:MAG TPA: selenium cofactor biosynthesis protein YqeC [Candidatus Limnocylindria bacterium]|nr:selenium cofactor biosynthesis protein YqeC [Candidatus Limnocylindria bacterium]